MLINIILILVKKLSGQAHKISEKNCQLFILDVTNMVCLLYKSTAIACLRSVHTVSTVVSDPQHIQRLFIRPGVQIHKLLHKFQRLLILVYHLLIFSVEQ